MKTLAILLALGWFWIAFYSLGPLTTGFQIAVGGLVLVAGCLAFALGGALAGSRRRPR